MSTDQQLEQELQARGLTAPRITPADIDALLQKSQVGFWQPEGTTLTICVIQLPNGFCVTGETALFCYKCTELYAPEHEGSILWNDPAIGIAWPLEHPTLSAKDAAAPPLAAVSPARLPTLTGER